MERQVPAEVGKLQWIKEIRLVIHSTGMRIDTDEAEVFGAAGLLTNGLRLTVSYDTTDMQIFSGGVTNIRGFFPYAATVTGVTGGVSSPGTDYLMVKVVFQQPVGLFPGSSDRIFLEVRDDLTALTHFTATAKGWWESV